MLKTIMCFLVLNLSLFAFEFNVKTVKSELIKVDDIYGYIKDGSDIRLHSSGVVVQHFKNSQSIIARASVVAKENGLAKLKFGVFSALKQEALPLPNVLPKIGDEVVLNFLYDRGLVVAPDEQTYNQLIKEFPQIYFTHIDIFGAQLIRTSTLSPRRSDFRKFCFDNAIGVLLIALENKAQLLDCQDFSKLYEIPIVQSISVQIPFYSRIEGYKANFFDFNSEQMRNYYEYYNALIDFSKVK